MLSAAWHRHIFLFGLIGLAAGMLFGTVPTSIPQIILAANWLLEGNFKWKWQQLKSNKIFWILASLFFLHVIGMTYTENIQRGLDDLRNKMPLLVLPLILFSTKPLSIKEFKLLFGFFFLSVFVSSICCYLVYAGFTKKVIIDVRKASVFMSHIRFSLFIAFAIIGLLYYSIKEKQIWIKISCAISTVWLLFFMYKLEMATGFISLVLVGSLLLILFSLKWLPKKVSLALVLCILIASAFVLKSALSSLDMYNKNSSNSANILLEKTKSGGVYLQDTIFGLAENGNLITININDRELEKEWNLRSSIRFDGADKLGNGLRYTLLRYMASKGLTKDSMGIISLSQQDILNIENGSSNYKYSLNSGLATKWRELVWEYIKYKRGENPSGHTLSMRLEFWKTASYIIGAHPVFGVGTGDIQDSFNNKYVETNSQLEVVWRLRCHNQYLAIGVAFGCVGLLLFMFYLLYPAFVLRKDMHYLYWPFFLIALLSFVTEDTLETQSGVTFFIFFQTLFLWLASFKEIKPIKKPT
ncbi:MAG: O-antigen ligase family protein [Bacteroidetes bacterium]|nr:O-antigen ligase family protein [Bacteroidota bacterium]